MGITVNYSPAGLIGEVAAATGYGRRDYRNQQDAKEEERYRRSLADRQAALASESESAFNSAKLRMMEDSDARYASDADRRQRSNMFADSQQLEREKLGQQDEQFYADQTFQNSQRQYNYADERGIMRYRAKLNEEAENAAAQREAMMQDMQFSGQQLRENEKLDNYADKIRRDKTLSPDDRERMLRAIEAERAGIQANRMPKESPPSLAEQLDQRMTSAPDGGQYIMQPDGSIDHIKAPSPPKLPFSLKEFNELTQGQGALAKPVYRQKGPDKGKAAVDSNGDPITRPPTETEITDSFKAYLAAVDAVQGLFAQRTGGGAGQAGDRQAEAEQAAIAEQQAAAEQQQAQQPQGGVPQGPTWNQVEPDRAWKIVEEFAKANPQDTDEIAAMADKKLRDIGWYHDEMDPQYEHERRQMMSTYIMYLQGQAG